MFFLFCYFYFFVLHWRSCNMADHMSQAYEPHTSLFFTIKLESSNEVKIYIFEACPIHHAYLWLLENVKKISDRLMIVGLKKFMRCEPLTFPYLSSPPLYQLYSYFLTILHLVKLSSNLKIIKEKLNENENQEDPINKINGISYYFIFFFKLSLSFAIISQD